MLCDHTHEGRLADTGAGENTDTLSLADRVETIDRLDAEFKLRADRRTIQRICVAGVDGVVQRILREGCAAIDRLAHRVNDTALQEIADRDLQTTMCVPHESAGGDAARRLIGHELDLVLLEADDLRRHIPAKLVIMDHADVAD